jgi:hypothetical protein
VTKDAVALEIFLRRMPGERYNETSKQGFVAAAKAAVEIAELFMGELNGDTLVHAEGITFDLRRVFEEERERNDGIRTPSCSCNFIGPDTNRCPRHSPSEREEKSA